MIGPLGDEARDHGVLLLESEEIGLVFEEQDLRISSSAGDGGNKQGQWHPRSRKRP